MNLFLNDHPLTVSNEETVAEILERQGIVSTNTVVFLDDKLLEPTERSTIRPLENSRMTVLAFVGGG